MKGFENVANMILIYKREIEKVISDFNLQTSREWSYKWFYDYKWVKNETRRSFKVQMSQKFSKSCKERSYKVKISQKWSCRVLRFKRLKNEFICSLRFKRVSNEAKMILVCKWAKNEDVKGFEVRTSQEWS